MARHADSDEATKMKLPCGASCEHFKGLDRDFFMKVKCALAEPINGNPHDRILLLVRARACPGGRKAIAHFAKPPPDP